MSIIHNILKEISEKAKFANKEMVDIDTESLLIISKMETHKFMDNKEIEPLSNFQNQSKLPPIRTKAKHSTAQMASKNHLSVHTNTSSAHIVKSSSLSRQSKTKPLPTIVPQTGKLHPATKPPKSETYDHTKTQPQESGRPTPPGRAKAYELRQLAGSCPSVSADEVIKTHQPVHVLDARFRLSISTAPVVRTTNTYGQYRQGTDINNEYIQLQRAIDRVVRNPVQPPLQERVGLHEPEPRRPMRRPRTEKQDHVPCRRKSNEGKSRSEANVKEKPNQRKPKKKQQKKKVERAPMKIEERPPFLSDIKPSKYFSEISRFDLSDVP